MFLFFYGEKSVELDFDKKIKFNSLFFYPVQTTTTGPKPIHAHQDESAAVPTPRR